MEADAGLQSDIERHGLVIRQHTWSGFGARGKVFVMAIVNGNYVVDESGTRVGVILSIDEYRKLLEELEELEAIRAYDAAKNSGDQPVPFEQAVRELEQERE